jgi:hypothetical protein
MKPLPESACTAVPHLPCGPGVVLPQLTHQPEAQPPDSIPNPLLLSSQRQAQAAPPRSICSAQPDAATGGVAGRGGGACCRPVDTANTTVTRRRCAAPAGRRCHRPRRREISSATTPPPRPREISPASPSPPKDLAGPAPVMPLTRRRPQVSTRDPSLLSSATDLLFPT